MTRNSRFSEMAKAAGAKITLVVLCVLAIGIGVPVLMVLMTWGLAILIALLGAILAFNIINWLLRKF